MHVVLDGKFLDDQLEGAVMVLVRVRDEDGVQLPVQVGAPVKEVGEIFKQLIVGVSVLAAGVNHDGAARELDDGGCALPDIKVVDPHGVAAGSVAADGSRSRAPGRPPEERPESGGQRSGRSSRRRRRLRC